MLTAIVTIKFCVGTRFIVREKILTFLRHYIQTTEISAGNFDRINYVVHSVVLKRSRCFIYIQEHFIAVRVAISLVSRSLHIFFGILGNSTAGTFVHL